MNLLICYDIHDPRTLRRTAKLLRQHGERVQKSVFLCKIPSGEEDYLCRELKKIVRVPDSLYVGTISRTFCRQGPQEECPIGEINFF